MVGCTSVGPLEEQEAAALVAAYQQGDREALASLHARLKPAIGAVLRRYRPSDLPGAVTAQDIHQQSWVILAELAVRWRPTGSFLAFFFRSFPHALRRYVEGARSRRRRVEVVTLPHDDLLAQMDRVQQPQVAVEGELSWEEMLADLPAGERSAFLLHAVEKRTFADIGRRLGVSHSSAHRLYRRAVAQLSGRVGAPFSRWAQSPLARLAHALHADVGSGGAIPGRRRVLAATGLGRKEYSALMAELEAAGAIVARGPGRPGRLADPTVAATLARLGVFHS